MYRYRSNSSIIEPLEVIISHINEHICSYFQADSKSIIAINSKRVHNSVYSRSRPAFPANVVNYLSRH